MVKFTIHGKLPGLNEYITAERANRYKGAEMKRQAEAAVLHAARSLGKWRADGKVRMVYRWYEANQRRDKDNVSSFGRKVIQDALVKGTYLPNDGWKDIADFEDRFAVDKKNPRIEVEIWEVKSDAESNNTAANRDGRLARRPARPRREQPASEEGGEPCMRH